MGRVSALMFRSASNSETVILVLKSFYIVGYYSTYPAYAGLCVATSFLLNDEQMSNKVGVEHQTVMCHILSSRIHVFKL